MRRKGILVVFMLFSLMIFGSFTSPKNEKESNRVEAAGMPNVTMSEVYNIQFVDYPFPVFVTKKATKLINKCKNAKSRNGTLGFCEITPMFYGNNPVCSCFKVYVEIDGEPYIDCMIENKEPGYKIDYSTGAVTAD